MPKVTKEKVEPKSNEIVIKETEDDAVLGGFNGDLADLKSEIKKEAEKTDVFSKYILPFVVFIMIAGVSAFATLYYAKPERREEPKLEDKIQTPPKVQETTPAPTAPATPAPATPAQPSVVAYTVKEGDTMSSIANSYGMSSTELAAYNGISDVNNLHIGQTLKVPVK